MTQEEIRATWQEAAGRFYMPTPDEFERRYREKKETALEKLAMKYKKFSRLSLMMMIVCVFYLFPNHIFPQHFRFLVAGCFLLYFATCSCMDYWLHKGVKSIDCYTMTVKEVAEKAMYYKRKHLLFMAILLPFAIGLIGLLIYVTGGDKFIIAGVCTGALVGGCLGYRQYLDFMAEYRKLSE